MVLSCSAFTYLPVLPISILICFSLLLFCLAVILGSSGHHSPGPVGLSSWSFHHSPGPVCLSTTPQAQFVCPPLSRCSLPVCYSPGPVCLSSTLQVQFACLLLPRPSLSVHHSPGPVCLSTTPQAHLSVHHSAGLPRLSGHSTLSVHCSSVQLVYPPLARLGLSVHFSPGLIFSVQRSSGMLPGSEVLTLCRPPRAHYALRALGV